MTSSIDIGPQCPQATIEVAKKVKRNRVKSVYRDAQFRPVFQALMTLEAEQAEGRTSVIYSTPSHPLFPILRLTSTNTPNTNPTSHVIAESLSDEEEIRTAKHWRAFNVSTPRKHRVPAQWRELSDIAALEWWHYALRTIGPVSAFTLHFSQDVEAEVRAQPKSAAWLSKRIARRLKAALGRTVDFWFSFELSDDHRLHVHGELQAFSDELPAARKALRLAGGEWDEVRQHQAHSKQEPSVVWSNYAAKDSIWTRPLKGRFENNARPINGDWVFATNTVRSKAAYIYGEKREIVMKAIQEE